MLNLTRGGVCVSDGVVFKFYISLLSEEGL